MIFPTDYSSILEKLKSFDPSTYGKTRNYLDGNVSMLSPYISRGVLSTKQVLDYLSQQSENFNGIRKYVQELAWRDYWQVMWNYHGNRINSDLKHSQPRSRRTGIPVSILTATTGINQIDSGIQSLLDTGYMHNHMRMYVASLATNLSFCHWSNPAKWMYYHLLDADWASNTLSWQWVAGSNSNKLYVANQWNINTYSKTEQRQTFLDVDYEAFNDWQLPFELKDVEIFDEKTNLPTPSNINLTPSKNVALYTFYNLDPLWKMEEDMNRVLILEPSLFQKYPVSSKTIKFVLDLGRNINDLQVFVGEFDEFANMSGERKIYFKQHPTNSHFKGIEDQRDWISSVDKAYPSFFGFWKKVQKEIFK